MARPEIKIKIDGDGVSPETVRWVDLREIVSGIYDAVVATAVANGIQRTDVKFSLVDVKKSSDLLEIATDPATHLAVQPIISAISSRDDSQLGYAAREGLERSHRPLRRLNYSATISRNGSPETRAVMLPNEPLFDAPADALAGGTSLLIQVVRVGGIVRPTARIQLATGQQITASVTSRDVASALAAKLYKTIQVHAYVTWNTVSNDVREVRITGVGNYCLEEADPVGSLKRLGEISEGYWNTVSPSDYLKGEM